MSRMFGHSLNKPDSMVIGFSRQCESTRYFALRSRVASHREGNRKPDTENVYGDADYHHFERERKLSRRREWNDNAIHEEVHSHAVDCAGDDRLLSQERNRAAHQVVGGGCANRDHEMADETEHRGCEASVAGSRSEQPCCNALQDRDGPCAEESIDHERRSDVEGTGEQSGPKDRSAGAMRFHGCCHEADPASSSFSTALQRS